jgi:PleD family two-component response regulator
LKEDFKKVSNILRIKKNSVNGRISNLEEAINVFSQILTRVLIQNMKAEDFEKLGLNVQRLLSEETPVESLEVILEYLKKEEEDFAVSSRKGAEDYWSTKKKAK